MGEFEINQLQLLNEHISILFYGLRSQPAVFSSHQDFTHFLFEWGLGVFIVCMDAFIILNYIYDSKYVFDSCDLCWEYSRYNLMRVVQLITVLHRFSCWWLTRAFCWLPSCRGVLPVWGVHWRLLSTILTFPSCFYSFQPVGLIFRYLPAFFIVFLVLSSPWILKTEFFPALFFSVSLRIKHSMIRGSCYWFFSEFLLDPFFLFSHLLRSFIFLCVVCGIRLVAFFCRGVVVGF